MHRGFPRKFESSNVGRDNVSREIGRKPRSLAASTVEGESAQHMDLALPVVKYIV